jgi:hypothetical protein
MQNLSNITPELIKANGVILYEGPSKLDGSPIVVIATGIRNKSANEKTGAMVQTYIIRSDMAPIDAIAQGKDDAICGGCTHRASSAGYREDGSVFYKERSCYVNIGQGPRSVYDGFIRGIYPKANAFQAAELLAGKMVRLGTYGDPAAAPIAIWTLAVSKAAGWTGYTHQWRTVTAAWSKLVMASADTESDMTEAHAMGYRTFRVTANAHENIKGLEAICPASDEKGNTTNCATCKACMGTSGKAKVSIQIAAHGGSKKYVGQRLAA